MTADKNDRTPIGTLLTWAAIAILVVLISTLIAFALWWQSPVMG